MRLFKPLICLFITPFLANCFFLPLPISESKFQERIDNLESHTYSKAVVTYKNNITGTGVLEENADKSSGEITYNYDYSYQKWTTSSTDSHATEYSFVLYSIKGSKITSSSYDEDIPQVSIKQTYYDNPLKFSVKRTGDFLQNGISFKINETTTYTFNKYGYCTKATYKCDDKINGSLGSGVTVSGTQKGNQTITVSFK